MKIYFAGSIRGGRDDVKLYQQIINFISGYGEVLTEHVGNENLTKISAIFIKINVYIKTLLYYII